jgi:hypothetical protein
MPWGRIVSLPTLTASLALIEKKLVNYGGINDKNIEKVTKELIEGKTIGYRCEWRSRGKSGLSYHGAMDAILINSKRAYGDYFAPEHLRVTRADINTFLGEDNWRKKYRKGDMKHVGGISKFHPYTVFIEHPVTHEEFNISGIATMREAIAIYNKNMKRMKMRGREIINGVQ